MKYLRLLPALCALVASSACIADSGAPGPGIPPVSTQCNFEGAVYDDGEEFDSNDGCVSYQCDEGALLTVADDRTTVQGDLALRTQAEVDAQVCLGVVEGSLTLSDEVADLTALRSLYRVGRDLSITGTEATTLAGLSTLGEVGGNIVIADNEALTAMSFSWNMTALGDATIQNNDALTSLAGAEFISQCGSCTPPEQGSGAVGPEEPGVATERAGDAEPAGDGADIAGPAGGGTFYGKILIADNDALVNIWALSGLSYAWDDVRLRNNASLTGVGNLELTEVQGDLEISEHPMMETAQIELLVDRIEVWGETTVCGNLEGEDCS